MPSEEPSVVGVVSDLSDLEAKVSSQELTIFRLEKAVTKFKETGWNREKAVKLRRLETFYTRFVNMMQLAESTAPYEMLTRLKKLADEELKHLPENPWT